MYLSLSQHRYLSSLSISQISVPSYPVSGFRVYTSTSNLILSDAQVYPSQLEEWQPQLKLGQKVVMDSPIIPDVMLPQKYPAPSTPDPVAANSTQFLKAPFKRTIASYFTFVKKPVPVLQEMKTRQPSLIPRR